MNRFICPAILLAIHLAPATGTAAPADKPAWKPDRVVAYKTVKTEKGTFPLQLHIFNPAGEDSGGKRPCVVLFHGGGWVSGEPAKCYSQCKRWVSRGQLFVMKGATHTQRSKEQVAMIEAQERKFMASLGYCETGAAEKNLESNPATR